MGTSIGTPVSPGANVNQRTLAWLTLRLAEINAPDLRQSVATSGTVSTLVDTVGLTQADDHWLGGSVWILSGGFAGMVKKITDSDQSSTNITFDAFVSAISAGIEYAVCGADAPYTMLKMAINQALREVAIEKINKTLVGVYDTYEYSLPTGVTRVASVDLYRDGDKHISTHWAETEDGKLLFDTGFSPLDDDVIWVHYLSTHADLDADDDEIEGLLEVPALMKLATEKLLRLLYHRFGGDQKQLPEWLADAIERNKQTGRITRNPTRVIVHTSGW